MPKLLGEIFLGVILLYLAYSLFMGIIGVKSDYLVAFFSGAVLGALTFAGVLAWVLGLPVW